MSAKMCGMDSVSEPRVTPVTRSLATTVIVCTFDADADALHRSLASVFAGDIGNAETLILIGPTAQAPDLSRWPARCVRVVRTTGTTPGALRNDGVHAAAGEIVAWCDAGDQWTAHHLAPLQAALATEPRAGFVWSCWSAYDGGPEQTTREVSLDAPPISAIAHRRSAVLRAGGFDLTLPAFECADLCLRMTEDGSCALVDAAGGSIVGERAAGVPSVIQASRREILREESERATRRRQMEERIDRRRARGARFERGSWCDGRRLLAWRGSFSENDSFGVVTLGLTAALEPLGVTIQRVPLQAGRDDAIAATFAGSMALCTGFPLAPATMPNEIVLAYSVLEASRISSVAIREWDQTLTLLYMPCRHNTEACRAHGVETPTRTLHHGVDPLRFPFLDRSRQGDEPFTFGSFSSFSPRKGIDVLVRAFRDEFRQGEAVRLALHSTRQHPAIDGIAADPRITLSVGFLELPALHDFLQRLDAFVLPSRGEGFGLTGIEAMATGLPLIATNWSGPADYLAESDSYPLDYQLLDLGGQRINASRRWWGRWAEPSYEHLRQLLRHLYEHPDEARAAGRRASTRVHTCWTWERPARQLLADLDSIAAGMTPPEEPLHVH